MSSIESTSINKLSPVVASTEKIYKKMVRKPAYRFALFILGLPTFVISLVKYLLTERNSEYEQLRKAVEKELVDRGVREQLLKDADESYRKKLIFLNKKLGDNDFNDRVKKIVDKQFTEIVDNELSKRTIGTDIVPSSIHLTYCRLLNNRLFFVVSVISSLPMYLLMIIYANPYMKYIFERLLMMLFVVFGVTFLVFTILYFSPSDPAVNILGEKATQEQIAEFNKVYGLDQPYVVRLLNQFKGLVTFNMGKSYIGNEDVAYALSRRFPITLQLTFMSMIISILIAIPAGIISAMKQYSAFDYIFMFIALVGLSIPNFWLGLILVLTFSIKLGWLPATFMVGNPMTLIMPAIVFGTCNAASLARMTRSSMLEVKNQDFVLTAKAKGLSGKKVIMKHILGNALVPIVTMAGLLFGELLGGSAVIEKVFNVNGIGSFIVDKQFVPDIPVVLAGVVYVAIVISIVNLAVDILYAFLDPRIKSKMKSY